MKKTTLVLSALALSIGLAMGPVSSVVAAETASSSSQQLPSLAPMLEKVMPSVVSINVEGSAQVSNAGGIPPQFQQFFGDDSPFCQDGSPFQGSPMCQGGPGSKGGAPSKQDFRALGSGVIIDAAKGYVVTNNHVVDNATKINVKLSDGRSYEAKVIGKDPRTDIALLQLKDAKNLTAIKIADSDQLRVGDYTVAIGNPYGLGETVTSGIVSALGRSGLNVENYENFIQTDAAINRGNSGGALINLNGELIGINTAILAPDGGNIGIGFAIPSNMVKNLTSQMVEFGQVKRGELGIMG
ncbi:trypsin-like peptidase domain-containing protein, partial [Yersinia enterocolitica]